MTTTVAQMTREELQELIENTIERKFIELLDDPDIGLPLRQAMKKRLLQQQKEVANGERGESFDEVAIDYSDIPELDESFFQQARLAMPDRVDEEIILWFKAHYGEAYLTQISTVLRQYVDAHS